MDLHSQKSNLDVHQNRHLLSIIPWWAPCPRVDIRPWGPLLSGTSLRKWATARSRKLGTQMLEDTGHVSSEAFPCLLSFPHEEMAPCCVGRFSSQYFPVYQVSTFFLSHHEACGILDPWPGIEPGAPEMKVPNPNHWTTRKFPIKGNDGRTLLKWWVQDEISAPRGTWPALGTVRLWVTLHTFVRVNRRNLTSS